MIAVELLPLRAAKLAREALEEEPAVWPRLGLVGPHSQGAHQDMDASHFHASAAALEPYFADVVRLGLGVGIESPHARALARSLGRSAERDMLAATGGRNTHKGALFLFGVFLLAWASLLRARPRASVASSLSLASAGFAPGLFDELERTPAAQSYGAWAYHRFGALGMRGLVLQRFAPLREVWRHSLARDRGSLGNARLLAAALSDDTNLIKRAGLATRERLRGELYGLWARGGTLDPRNAGELARLEAWVERRGWSAAASGDLVAALILFRKLCSAGLARP